MSGFRSPVWLILKEPVLKGRVVDAIDIVDVALVSERVAPLSLTVWR